MSTVNMTKTLVGPRVKRDDPFGSLKKNSSIKWEGRMEDCRKKEGEKNAKALPEVTASRNSR